GYLRTMRWTRSICSSVVLTAVPFLAVSTGTQTDQNCAPTPPSRSRGMSVCSPFCRLPMSTLPKRGSPRSRSLQGRSLWPSMSRASLWIASAASVSLTGGRFFGLSLISAGFSLSGFGLSSAPGEERSKARNARTSGSAGETRFTMISWKEQLSDSLQSLLYVLRRDLPFGGGSHRENFAPVSAVAAWYNSPRSLPCGPTRESFLGDPYHAMAAEESRQGQRPRSGWQTAAEGRHGKGQRPPAREIVAAAQAAEHVAGRLADRAAPPARTRTTLHPQEPRRRTYLLRDHG